MTNHTLLHYFVCFIIMSCIPVLASAQAGAIVGEVVNAAEHSNKVSQQVSHQTVINAAKQAAVPVASSPVTPTPTVAVPSAHAPKNNVKGVPADTELMSPEEMEKKIKAAIEKITPPAFADSVQIEKPKE